MHVCEAAFSRRFLLKTSPRMAGAVGDNGKIWRGCGEGANRLCVCVCVFVCGDPTGRRVSNAFAGAVKRFQADASQDGLSLQRNKGSSAQALQKLGAEKLKTHKSRWWWARLVVQRLWLDFTVDVPTRRHGGSRAQLRSNCALQGFVEAGSARLQKLAERRETADMSRVFNASAR